MNTKKATFFISQNIPRGSMRRVQQKISQGLDVIQYFTMREWVFDSTKYRQVFEQLSEDDKKM